MITVELSDKKGWLNIYITGQSAIFDLAKAIVNDMPVREYVAKLKAWRIPMRDLKLLTVDCTKNNVDIKLGKRVSEQYNKLAKQINSQAKIKKLSRNIHGNVPETIEEFANRFDRLKLPLFRYQKFGCMFTYLSTKLPTSRGAFVGDVVGLGKTCQVLATVEYMMERQEINYVIIVCPSTLKRNWEAEIEKFTTSRMTMISGAASSRRYKFKRAYKYEYLIINYDLLRLDYKFFEEFIFTKNIEFALVLDEAQAIKTWAAQRSRFARKIAEKAKCILPVSATPYETTPGDMYNLLSPIDETVFGHNYIKFLEKFCKTDIWDKATGVRDKKVFLGRYSPIYLRRLKYEVKKDLPQVIDNNYWVELHQIQRKFYDDVRQKILDEIMDEEKAAKILLAKVLPMLIYLRQCVLSAQLIGHEKNISTKCQELLGFLENIERGDKVLLFCYFAKMIEILDMVLDKEGIPHVTMTGNRKSKHFVKIDDRIPRVKQWNESIDVPVMICTDILSAGVNADQTNYVINFDILYNPAKMEQRYGRADRITSTVESINVINFVAQDTVEENMFKLYSARRQEGSHLTNEGRSDPRLTIRDIRKLLDVNGKKND